MAVTRCGGRQLGGGHVPHLLPPCCAVPGLRHAHTAAPLELPPIAGRPRQTKLHCFIHPLQVVECSKLPNSGVLQNGCPTAVNGTPLTAANQDVWPASQTLCAKRASKFY